MRNPLCKLCERRNYCKPTKICIYGNSLPSSTKEIMIVIDTISSATNETGKLLDGQSGNVLKKLLNSVGILEKCYITTAVKCWSGHKPKASEIRSCRYYLLEEIKEVKPKLIICLGAVAAQGLIGKHIASKQLRQRVLLSESGIKIGITFSHTSIFVNPNIYNQCSRDLHWIINNYKKETEKFDWNIKINEQISQSNIYGLDIETTGLNTYVDKILTIAIANPNNKESIGYNIGMK